MCRIGEESQSLKKEKNWNERVTYWHNLEKKGFARDFALFLV